MESVEEQITHTNVITDEYVEYIEAIDRYYFRHIYTRMLKINLLGKVDGTVKLINTEKGFRSYPLAFVTIGYLEENYDLLQGNSRKASMILSSLSIRKSNR